jgi:biotin/methionine sulfoxide reductase
MSKLIEPNGQARDDYDIFAGIAEEMGVGDAFTEGRSKLDWQRWIYEQTQDRAQAAKIDMPNYETFLKDGWFKLNDPVKPTVMLESFREDPAANPLDTPSGRIEIFC